MIACLRGRGWRLERGEMPIYRCFFRDRDRTVIRLDRAEHADDDMAKLWATALLKEQSTNRRCELWQGDRLVERIGRKD